MKQWSGVQKVYLNGVWVETGQCMEVVNPATELPFARVSTITEDHVREALDQAERAFRIWRMLTARERGAWLLRIADEVRLRTEEIAHTITLENGKPLAQSRGEATMAEDHLRWFAGECQRSYGRIVPHQVGGKRNLVVKTPIGVVGAIAPWNFPLVLAVRKVAPALAAGCPVILKPATQTPLSAILFAECVAAAGLQRAFSNWSSAMPR